MKRMQGLTSWTIIEDRLIGSITLPLAIATVGGATKILPKAQAALALTGVETASELASLAASVGLVQNLVALRALVSEGIQQVYEHASPFISYFSWSKRKRD